MTDSTKVWMPDSFFRNEKNGKFHNIIQPNLYVRIYPNGDVLYSIRVSVDCKWMRLEKYVKKVQYYPALGIAYRAMAMMLLW